MPCPLASTTLDSARYLPCPQTYGLVRKSPFPAPITWRWRETVFIIQFVQPFHPWPLYTPSPAYSRSIAVTLRTPILSGNTAAEEEGWPPCISSFWGYEEDMAVRWLVCGFSDLQYRALDWGSWLERVTVYHHECCECHQCCSAR